MNWIIEIIFFAICIALGKYQAWLFDVKQKRISHFLWACGYGALLIPVYLLSNNWWLVAACGLMHLPVFNTALNYFRIPRRSIFYTHPKDKKGSVLDKIWGKCYPVVFFISIGLLIWFQFKL